MNEDNYSINRDSTFNDDESRIRAALDSFGYTDQQILGIRCLSFLTADKHYEVLLHDENYKPDDRDLYGSPYGMIVEIQEFLGIRLDAKFI